MLKVLTFGTCEQYSIAFKTSCKVALLSICRGGHAQLFLSPQSQFRNLKEALPQSQFRNFLKICCSATAIPQSQFFLKSATWEFFFRNFRYIFLYGVARIYIFFITRWFLLLRGSKGTVAQDVWPLKLFRRGLIPHRNLFRWVWYPKFRVWIRNPYGVDSRKTKNRRPKISCYCSFKASFWIP